MLHTNRLNKRAQGLPITTIIIAVIGLIVLVILVVLVQQQVTKTGKGLRNVSESNCPGEVAPIGTDCDIIYGSYSDAPAGQKICCKTGTIK
ncbi:hypothetical protein KY319_02865 [Candidatus Woesearchaeota archaeon]|nr:hypothetical protein [Candidatus Woesearchaeota archaeon]